MALNTRTLGHAALVLHRGPVALRRLSAGAAVLALGALGGCTDAPLCRYWSDGHIGKLLDPSQVPMLPDNPYWVGKESSGSPRAAEDPCAGEPPARGSRG